MEAPSRLMNHGRDEQDGGKEREKKTEKQRIGTNAMRRCNAEGYSARVKISSSFMPGQRIDPVSVGIELCRSVESM
jgi:hypothetical protein